MAVLVHLAEANGAVVSRNHLLDTIWPKMAVTPDALSQCLVELRRAFGDDPKSPQTIETIRRIGVRLIAPITVEGSGEPQPYRETAAPVEPPSDATEALILETVRRFEPQPHRVWRLVAGTVAAVVALGAILFLWQAERSELKPSSAAAEFGRRSIAVLPLAYDSTAGDRVRLFADGMQDELLIRLANVEAFDKVPSRQLVLPYRGTHKTAQEIGQELGVGAVVESRVRSVEGAINLNVQLIDTETGAILWGDSYIATLSARDFFAVQSEMAVAVVGALDAKLSEDELMRLRDVPTTNTRALEFYLSGNEYWQRNHNPNTTLPVIVKQYTRATEEDPGFALAWARLSFVHTGMYFRDLDHTPARIELAEAALRTAFELAPALAEAHLAKAAYLGRGLGDYDGALTELAMAEPWLRRDAEFYSLRGHVYRYMGKLELSLADHARALELDPGNVGYLRARSLVERSMRNYAATARTLDRIIELAPDNGSAYVDRVFLDLYAYGDTTLANIYERLPPSANYASALASTYVRWLAAIFDRDYARALNVLNDSNEERVFDGDLRNSFTPKSLLYARTHQLAGNRTAAVDSLLQAKRTIEQQLALPQVEGKPFAPLQIALAEVHAALGDSEVAAAALARVGEVASGRRLAIAIRVLVPLGKHDRALEEIDNVLGGPGKWTIEGLRADPRLEPVRRDPGFSALVEKYESE